SVDSTRNTLFSRHFYSTLQDVRNPRRTGPQNAADKAAIEGNQIALPFFPAGSPQVPPESWIEDIAIRWDRLIRRISERVRALTSQPARRKQYMSLSELVRKHRTLNE